MSRSRTVELSRRAELLCEHLSFLHSGQDFIAALAKALEAQPTAENVWMCLTVMTAGYPTGAEVREARNLLSVVGGEAFLNDVVHKIKKVDRVEFEFVVDAVIVDVMHTANTELATGIQRVVRETVSRWNKDHTLVLATWTLDRRSMRRLTPAEKKTALYGAKPPGLISKADASSVLVPIGGRYIMPELGAEHWRTSRVSALAENTRISSGLIGHDCVPLTTAETTGAGMPAGFARYLSAASRMSRISVTSVASQAEYAGWKVMLHGVGLEGPTLKLQPLACEIKHPTESELSDFGRKFRATELPLIVVVGSHEPRKNHLAVLRAVEKRWAAGDRFEVLFIGGNSWNSSRFDARVAELRGVGIPVQTASAVTDAELYAAYSTATFTIYPSINEGFGLPVAESLMLHTPVITSGFGSMADIGRHHGAVLVDPRQSDEIADAMKILLSDDKHYAELVEQTKTYRAKTWDEYADETWEFLGA